MPQGIAERAAPQLDPRLPHPPQHLGGQQPGTAFRTAVAETKTAQRSTSPTEDTTGHAPESIASLERCDGRWREQ